MNHVAWQFLEKFYVKTLSLIYLYSIFHINKRITLVLLKIKDMKEISIAVFLLLAHCGLSQIKYNIPIKYDSLVSIPESNRIVVYHKNKSGIYDLGEKKFITQMTKAHIQYLENSGWLFRIDKKTISTFPFEQTNLFLPRKKYETNIFSPFEGIAYRDGIERISENILVVNQFKHPISNTSYIPLKNQLGKDSVSIDGKYVYPPDILGVEKSGLYNVKTRTWIIPPKYTNLQVVGKYVFAIRELNDSGQYWSRKDLPFVDIFEIKKSNATFIKRKHLDQKNMDWSQELKDALQVESVERLLSDDNTYKLFQAGKQKIVYFTFYNELEYLDFFPNQWFDLIVYHPQKKQCLAFEQGKILHFSFDENVKEMHFVASSNRIAGINGSYDDLTFVYEEYEYLMYCELAIEKRNNHLIVHQHFPEFKSDYPLIDENGDDSVVVLENGSYEYVYAFFYPERHFSGVFDLEAKKWIVPEDFNFIIPLGQNYLAKKSIAVNFENFNPQSIQTLYDNQGKILLTHEQIEAMSQEDLAKKIFSDSEIYFANMQDRPIEMLAGNDSNTDILPLYFVQLKNGKQNLVRMDLFNGNSILQSAVLNNYSADFIDASFNDRWNSETKLNHTILYEKEVLNLKLSALLMQGNEFYIDSLEIQAPNFELHLYKLTDENTIVENQMACILLSLQVGDEKGDFAQNQHYGFIYSDTMARIKSISKLEFDNYLIEQSYNKHSFRREGDMIIVRKTPISVENHSDNFGSNDVGFVTINYSFVCGNSAVYKKSPEGWNMICGPFAELKNTTYGYLATENFTLQNIQIFDLYEEYNPVRSVAANAKLNSKKPAFQLLNPNFQPFNWKGQHIFSGIEEYSFGYRIFINENESILISPTGQIISEEHYEQYFIEDGKIVGFSEPIFEYDEFGDEVWDDSGNPIVQRAEKRGVFDLKP